MRKESVIAMLESFAEEDGQVESADLLTFSEVAFSQDEHYTYCIWHLCDLPRRATAGQLQWKFAKGRMTALAKGIAKGAMPSVGTSGGSAITDSLSNANDMYKTAKKTKGLQSKIDKQWAAAQSDLQAVADFSAFEATAGTSQEASTLLLTPGLFEVGGISVLVEDFFDDFASIATRYFPPKHYDAFIRRTSQVQQRYASPMQIHQRLADMAEELIFDNADGFYVHGHQIEFDSGVVRDTINPIFEGS